MRSLAFVALLSACGPGKPAAQSAPLVVESQVALGADADNVRVDARQVVIGYGSGGLAVFDPTSRKIVTRIPLPAHPESFQLDPTGSTIYINLPDAHQIAAVDRATGKPIGSLGAGLSFANFPMALDPRSQRLAVVFRAPSELRVYSTTDRSLVAKLGVCHDADDVFFDTRRNRIYVVCGEGVVDVMEPRAGGYARTARITTRPGARTGLWSPARDRLYVAAPARDGTGAAILALRPAP